MIQPRRDCARVIALMLGLFLAGIVSAAPVPVALDGDTDVDGDDLRLFLYAISGPGIPRDPHNEVNADFDHDGDVDLCDYGLMQAWFSGPGVPAAPAPAQDPSAVVAWTLAAPSQVTPGAPLPWSASVRVTGNNQGLALYAFALELRDSQGQLVGVNYGPTSYADSTFLIGGKTGDVTRVPTDGGPGMSLTQQPSSAGAPAGSLIQPGVLEGVGAAYMTWSRIGPYPQAMAGVGLDSAKTALLNDLDQDGLKTDELYVLNQGLIDTSGLIPGETYTLTLVPRAGNVLRSGIDLRYPQESYAALAGMLVGDAITFTVPEPASLALLLAGVAVLRRRGEGRPAVDGFTIRNGGGTLSGSDRLT